MTQAFQERRQDRRFSFAATATLQTSQGLEVSNVRILGLGTAGCRIATHRRLEVDEEFELTIQINGGVISAKVAVVYWRPQGFAGLHFTSMTLATRERLARLVEEVSNSASGPEGSSEG